MYILLQLWALLFGGVIINHYNIHVIAATSRDKIESVFDGLRYDF